VGELVELHGRYRVVKGWLIAAALVLGLAGFGVYHHVTGARFEVQMTPLDPLGFHIEIMNVGGRASYASCQATALDASGRVIFRSHVPTHVGADTYLEPGETWRSDERLPGELVTRAIARFEATCSSIDYHGHPPI
jgi:hypothetical protein